MKDFLIVYEVKRRELENAYLLKAFLNYRGFSCDICHFYESHYFSLFQRKQYRVIVVPQLYGTDGVERIRCRFGPTEHIVNLQCEQILSDDFEDLDLHTPKGLAREAIHICWGKRTFNKLVSKGLPPEQLPILGSLALDYLHHKILGIVSAKKSILAERHNLDPSRKWILFTSSFTMADMPKDRQAMDERILGIRLDERVKLFTLSRMGMLKWFKRLLEERKEDILIYRPHPDEFVLDVVYKLQERFPNFCIIREESVRTWVAACDTILNWYSTSCVEAYYLKRPYFVLRPLPIPEEIELELMKGVVKISTLEDLLNTNLDELDSRFHDGEKMNNFYLSNKKVLNVEKYIDMLIELLGKKSNAIYSDVSSWRFSSYLKTVLLYFLHKLYLVFLKKVYRPSLTKKSGLITLWLRAYYYNIASSKEKKAADRQAADIVSIICN